MLFHSHLFLFLFLPLTLAGWYFFNNRGKYRAAQGFLIGMSLWFYGYLNPACLGIFLLLCLLGYGLCRLAHTAQGAPHSARQKKMVLAAGVVLHLGALGYFKYADFFLENANALLGSDFTLLHVILPVGISFYTFQQLAYLIDCCRGETTVCSLLDYLTFQTYFPQVQQGPILLWDQFLPQLHERERRIFDAERFSKGICRFVIGLSKKVLLADTLAKAVSFGYDNVAYLDSPSAAFLAAGYMLELYFDFSGYCDMAVGIGDMIGLKVAENFDSPFLSQSVKEFWRRWHITLGRFFTKYVYIPLGGSRKGKLRTLLNTMVVFLLSGLWHGAGWTFVFWGFLHGAGVAFSVLFPSKKEKDGKEKGRLFVFLRQALTFSYVSLAFVFFRAPSIREGAAVLRQLFFGGWNGFLFQIASALDPSELYLVTKAVSLAAPALLSLVHMGILILFIAICLITVRGKKAAVLTEQMGGSRRFAVWMSVLFVWSVLSMTGVTTFLYFNF